MMTVEVSRGNKPLLAFQVDPKGGIKMGGKHVGGLDEINKIRLLSELDDLSMTCPKEQFIRTSEQYLLQKQG